MVKGESLGMVVEAFEALGGSQENEKKNRDISLLVCFDPAAGNRSVMNIHHSFHVQNHEEKPYQTKNLSREEMQAPAKSSAVPIRGDVKTGPSA
jgi:hypothetical protein